MKSQLWTATLLFLFFCSVVLSGAPNIILKPINVKAMGFPAFGVAKIDSTVSADAIIGRHRREENAFAFVYDGNLFSGSNKKSKNLSGNQVFNEQIVTNYKKIMVEELEKAGYQTSSAPVSNLFEEAQTSDNSRFQIGAIIAKCNVRTIQDPWSGNEYTECHLEEIEWQVFDRESKKVIHIEKTSGWDKKRGTTVQNAAVEAFRKSFGNLLASPNLITAVKTAIKSK